MKDDPYFMEFGYIGESPARLGPPPLAQPKPSTFLCRFGWHQWGMWIHGVATYTSIFYKGGRESVVQLRKCEACGKTQIKDIH